MGEGGNLLAHGSHDLVGGVADADDRYPRPEVDEGVAVDIDDDAAAGRLDEDREGDADPAGDRIGTPGQQLDRSWPRESR